MSGAGRSWCTNASEIPEPRLILCMLPENSESTFWPLVCHIVASFCGTFRPEAVQSTCQGASVLLLIAAENARLWPAFQLQPMGSHGSNRVLPVFSASLSLKNRRCSPSRLLKCHVLFDKRPNCSLRRGDGLVFTCDS